jgi:hypothetical protein
MVRALVFGFLMLLASGLAAQGAPSGQENIAYLVTFGGNSERSWGDDDFSQVLFFSIPKTQTAPFYIRVFDPDIGGELDEIDAGWDTKNRFSVYGGKGTYTDKDAKNVDPVGNYKSGILLDTRVFGVDAAADGKWVSFGPFNPAQGELVTDFDAYVFKLVVDGLNGNDGNLYKVFTSIKSTDNIPVEGANVFAYEYSVRLQSEANSVAHVYPFADNLVARFRIRNFDFDSDGQMKLYSSVKNGHLVKASGDDEWTMSEHSIKDDERNKCLDLQIVKKGDYKNDVVFYITNEYDVPVPFFAAPLGGIPRYKYKIKINARATAH